MRYLGGKFRTANSISAYLRLIREDRPYWEPFIGAGWVIVKIPGGIRFASDIHYPLIAMWQAIQGGWEPPSRVTRELYKRARAGKLPPHETGFIGFACSWGGKWFGGYNAGDGTRILAQEGRDSILAKSRFIKDVKFFQADFLSCKPPARNMLIYCDPPYQGMTPYPGIPVFDTPAFWGRVRELEAAGHSVVVSEYTAPPDFTCVHEMQTKTDLAIGNGGKAARTERLFRLGEHTRFQGVLPFLF